MSRKDVRDATRGSLMVYVLPRAHHLDRANFKGVLRPAFGGDSA